MENPACFSASDPPDGGAKLNTYHQYVEGLSLVLHRVLPCTGCGILLSGAHCILLQHPKLPRLLSVKAAVDSAPNCSGGYQMSGALEDHPLEDDEYLRVTAALNNSCEFCG